VSARQRAEHLDTDAIGAIVEGGAPAGLAALVSRLTG
jgi:hypothetical protein